MVLARKSRSLFVVSTGCVHVELLRDTASKHTRYVVFFSSPEHFVKVEICHQVNRRQQKHRRLHLPPRRADWVRAHVGTFSALESRHFVQVNTWRQKHRESVHLPPGKVNRVKAHILFAHGGVQLIPYVTGLSLLTLSTKRKWIFSFMPNSAGISNL